MTTTTVASGPRAENQRVAQDPMCGIAGFIHSDPTRRADAARLRRMTDAVAYRGPDGEGFFLCDNVALGHRRLEIIDLATGDQPMSTPDGALTISFNGEIYNYIELRAELKSLGHQFVTESDTEVILHAYEEWGLDCQTRFNGMWAFALWDQRRHRLLLSRDRLGEKPLHYAEDDGTIFFASEIKSLFAAGMERSIDMQWAEVYMCLSYLPSPNTFFKGVYKLPPASYLVWKDGAWTLGSYWDLPAIDENHLRQDSDAIAEEFSQLFSDSVRIRMRSDVPYGAFLSGGLDSGSVVATMAAMSSHPVQTFTMGFANERLDERPLARLVAKAFATAHHEEIVERAVLEESLARVLHHYDEPFGDAAAIPTGYLARTARRTVKMVLTGDGGDEALSGYTAYQGEKFASSYSRLPRPLQHAIPALVGGAMAPLRGRVRYKMNRVRNVTLAATQDFNSRLIAKVAWADIRLIKSLLATRTGVVPIEDFVSSKMSACPYRDPFYRLMYYHLKMSLPDRMLVKVDRMSMAHSLEIRTPFLDHRLIELLVGTDKSVKMRGYERKSILLRTIARTLPPALLSAPKKGFAVPVGDWFRDSALAHHTNGLTNSGGVGVAAKPLQELLTRNRRGEEDLGNLIWILMVLDGFCRSDANVSVA